MSSQFMSSHVPLTSKRFRHVILPEFNPWAGNTIGLIQQQLNKEVRVAAGATMAAFLTDSTFFKEVRGLLLQQQDAVMRSFGNERSSNDVFVPFSLDEMSFAGLSADVIDIVENGSVVNVTPPAAVSDGLQETMSVAARSLTFVSGAAVSSKSAVSKQPAHFQDQRYFVYDHACSTMFAGEAAGVRVPWAPHVVDHYNVKSRSLNFPVPSPFHYHATPAALSSSSSLVSGSAVGPTGSNLSAAAAALFSHWNAEESLETAVRAMSQFNSVQRVLSSSYGELGCDREDVIQRLTAATDALVALRKRLAAKHFSMGVTSSKAAGQCRDPLSGALHKKIWDELISASHRKSDDKAVVESVTGESDPKKVQLRAASRAVVSQLFAAGVASALSASAVFVAPSEGSVQAKILEDAKNQAEVVRNAAEQRAKKAEDAAETTPAASAASTAILDKLFTKRGLQQLSHILVKQDIDVGVFLAMKPDELTATFSVTFGLRKKLELLQTELKAKMGSQ
ncbi:Hypothetical protein, putative [Bodo saltans]|uniref:Uncharacterized protein n=1 Tax=Bodo saltans TaxID=75058 RepID=A0A0S4JF66_BODSA|nr:Hypothetical protein, putative [Bodo saltans]|eukprot:CUG90233.1 Hypothetical protein, putative [Bodo saltans]